MVEFALFASVLFGLIFAMLDFAVLMLDSNSAAQATRQAGQDAQQKRYTGNPGTCSLVSVTSPETDAAKLTAMRQVMCAAKARLGSPSRARVKIVFESAADPTVPGTGAEGDSIVVCTQYQGKSITRAFAPLIDRIVMKNEGRYRVEDLGPGLNLGVPSIAAGEEPSFSGASWSFCGTRLRSNAAPSGLPSTTCPAGSWKVDYWNLGTNSGLGAVPVVPSSGPSVTLPCAASNRPNIDLVDGASPDPMVSDNFVIARFTGAVNLPFGNTTFTTRSDDGIRLFVNGALVINNWTDHGAAIDSGTFNAPIAGTYEVVVEFYERTGFWTTVLTAP